MQKLILSYFLVFALAAFMVIVVVGTPLANWLLAPLSLVVASAAWALVKGLASVKGPMPPQLARVRAIRSSMASLEAMVFASLASAFPAFIHSILEFRRSTVGPLTYGPSLGLGSQGNLLLAVILSAVFLIASIAFSYYLIEFQEKLENLSFEEEKLMHEIGESS